MGIDLKPSLLRNTGEYGSNGRKKGGIEEKRSMVTRSNTSTEERKRIPFDGKAVNKQQSIESGKKMKPYHNTTIGEWR